MAASDCVIENVWAMQNELRNQEGITGIDAMHHINLVLLSRSFTHKQCVKLSIPGEYSYENLISLTQGQMFTKFWNNDNRRSCLLYHIYNGSRFGYTSDIQFQIKNAGTLWFLFTRAAKIPVDLLFNKTDLIGDIYEHFINREGKTMKDLGQYFTDRSLIKYLVKLVNPKFNGGTFESVWDPAAGTGGFLIEYIKHMKDLGATSKSVWSINKDEICGNDINANTAALLKLNIYYSLQDVCGPTFNMRDSLKTEVGKKFDIILGNPPFGVKGLKYCDMNDGITGLKINGTKGEILFLQLAMSHLKENGRCCLVVPEGVLFNCTKMYRETRTHLMTHFNLKKVIKMGEGEFFKHTGVKTSVLFFERNGVTKDVEFIQVDRMDDGTLQEINLLTVPIDKIIADDYSLNMNLYKEITYISNETYDIKQLSEICYNKKGQQIKIKGEGLTGDYPIVSGGTHICGYYHKYNREGNTILLSSSGNAGFVSLYPSKLWAADCWSIHSNDEQYLTNMYLYHVLKYMQNIIYEYQTGSVIKHIAFKDIKKLKIPIPPLVVQARIVAQLDNIHETEISQSRSLIKGLKTSIETIMKNTMYRKDLTEYRLGDVVDIHTGSSLRADDKIDGEYPYYGSNGPIAKYNTFQQDGEYIITGRVGTVGKYHYIHGKFSLCDNAFHIKNKSGNITRYIYFNLQYNAVVNCNDTVVSQISKKYFKSVKIFLPPPNIQQEILAKIEPKEQLIQLLQDNIDKATLESKEIMDVLFQ